MRTPVRTAVLSCGLAGLMMAAAPAALGETVYVTAERLLDVATGRMIPSPAITIEDGVITAVASAVSGQPPAGARRVALPGVTLLPGLIDMHTHLDSDPTFGGFSDLKMTDAFWSIIAVPAARKTLEAGFTTVRNVGSRDWNDVAFKQAIEAGKISGPRIIPAAYSFGATGGHCDSTGLPPSYNAHNPLNADSPDEARKSVREVRKYGAEVIKICATGGVFSHNTEPGQQQMTFAEIKAVVEEARMWGLRVAAHAHGASGIRDAALAGVTTIEHASLIDEAGIAAARTMGTFLSMDIYNTDYTQAEGVRNGVMEDNLRKDREIAEVQRQGFKRALAAGVRMVYGTDSGVYPHGDNARQCAVMLRYGPTTLEAIPAATLDAGEALGWTGKVGVVEPEAFGDLVGVRGDPTRDVTLLERPVFVMKGGTTIRAPD